jgi:hypothetical protein
MDLVALLIYCCLGLTALCLLAMAGFGLRQLLAGRRNDLLIGAFALALAVFAVAYAFADPSGYPLERGQAVTRGEVALFYTAVVMLALTTLALVTSGVRSAVRA